MVEVCESRVVITIETGGGGEEYLQNCQESLLNLLNLARASDDAEAVKECSGYVYDLLLAMVKTTAKESQDTGIDTAPGTSAEGETTREA